MQKLIIAISRNWLSLLLLLVLLAFSSTFLTNVQVSDGIVCAKDDASAAVCIRNWANSAGNLLTGLVALVAALIAFNQLRENKNQVSTALLAPLKERIDDIAALHGQATIVSNEFYELAGFVSRMKMFIDNGVNNLDLMRHSNAIANAERKLNAARKKLYDDAHNVKLYRDIGDVARQIAQDAYQRSDNNVGIVLDNCFQISETSDNDPYNRNQNVIRLRRESFRFDQAITALTEKDRRIRGGLHTLSVMASAVNDKRLAALSLGDLP